MPQFLLYSIHQGSVQNVILLVDGCDIGNQSCPIPFNDHGMAIASIMIFAFLTTKAFSAEKCVVRYDTPNNVVHIPCVRIGDEKV